LQQGLTIAVQYRHKQLYVSSLCHTGWAGVRLRCWRSTS